MSRKLHIGGTQRFAEWENLNIVPNPCVDHLCDARDLSRFPDDTFSDIYASHILEHFDYVKELGATLKEWYRVLKYGGKLYVSVPDLDILAQLFTHKELTFDERFFVMGMIFGGHADQYDYHMCGLNQEFLIMYLTQAGFIHIQRVDKFGFFEDGSCLMFKGVPISLNIITEKPVADDAR
jgi:predicted SAM-dependent methyltransferase